MTDAQKTPAPTRGIPVEMDRTRYFRYTLGTMRKLREEFGEAAMSKGLSGNELAKMVWYGLVGDDADLTPEKIEELIDGENIEAVIVAMKKALPKGNAIMGPRKPSPAAAAGEGGE